MNILQSWAKKIEDFFTGIGNLLHLQGFATFMEEAFVAIRPQVVAELKDIALEAVTVAEQAYQVPGSGKDKYEQAFKTIMEHAKTVAIGASKNEVNTVLELAVGVITGKKSVGGNGGNLSGGDQGPAPAAAPAV